MSFVCQQCKQPLQLDASLVDLSPSAHDVIASSLPPPKQLRSLSDAEKLAQLRAPESVKQAWRNSTSRIHLGTAADHARAEGKPIIRVPTATPNDSFVYLGDSVLHKIPQSEASSHQTNVVSPSVKQASHLSHGDASSRRNATHDSSHSITPPLSHHLRSSLRLFSLLSSRTEIDHPLCAECTHILLSTLSRQLEETQRERDGYIAFEKEARKERERDDSLASKDALETRIKLLKEEERQAIDSLKEAQREKERLDEELRLLEFEEKLLEEEETEFWLAHNSHLITAAQQRDQLESLRNAYARDSAVLERLERTNVYNDAFCIGHEGIFGTINGLRLGRYGSIVVEWSEINAAWGQALLLLYTISRKLDLTFENYRLIPMGSFSRIERTNGDKASYELYGSGELHLGRLLHNRRFDFAMVAFLDCLRQAMEFVKTQDPTVEFPHAIAKDKIGDVSIKLQFGVEEGWTRALRHVLLALKILLKWTTSGAG